MTEKQFQARVVKIAKTLGWKVYHTYDSRCSEPGFPDLVLVKNRVIFRELKTDTGKLRTEQKEWAASLTGAGCDFKVWRPQDMTSIILELKK